MTGVINSEQVHAQLFRCFSRYTYIASNARSTPVIAIATLYFAGKIVKSVVKTRFYAILPDFNNFTRFNSILPIFEFYERFST